MSKPVAERASVSPGYSLSELMVCAAAREIGDGELVFVGMRLPLIAFVALCGADGAFAAATAGARLIYDQPGQWRRKRLAQAHWLATRWARGGDHDEGCSAFR